MKETTTTTINLTKGGLDSYQGLASEYSVKNQKEAIALTSIHQIIDEALKPHRENIVVMKTEADELERQLKSSGWMKKSTVKQQEENKARINELNAQYVAEFDEYVQFELTKQEAKVFAVTINDAFTAGIIKGKSQVNTIAGILSSFCTSLQIDDINELIREE